MSDPVEEWVAARRREIQRLNGCVVDGWWGLEMALYETGPAGQPVFSDPAIPFLQLSVLGATLRDRTPINIGTYQNDDEFGLLLREGADITLPERPAEGAISGGIYRHRHIPELPTGSISDVVLNLSEQGNIAEVLLLVDNAPLLVLTGEVREGWSQTLDYVLGDESVLVFDDPTAADTVPWRNPNPYRAHVVEVVETDSGSARWKCTCGRSSGGRWSRSPQEALKAAEKHRRMTARATSARRQRPT